MSNDVQESPYEALTKILKAEGYIPDHSQVLEMGGYTIDCQDIDDHVSRLADPSVAWLPCQITNAINDTDATIDSGDPVDWCTEVHALIEEVLEENARRLGLI